MPAGQDELLIKLAMTGALTTGVKTAPESVFVVPFNLEVVRAWVVVGVAPTTSSAIFNVQRTKLGDGTTAQLWTTAANRPTIPIAGTTSWATTGVTPAIIATLPAVPDTIDLIAGDILNLNVVQIGSGTAGSDACLILHCEKN